MPCLSCGMWDLVPLRDWAQGPLPWEHGVLATGPPGKSSGLHVKGRGCSPWKVQSAARGLRGRHQIQLKTGEQTAWWDGLGMWSEQRYHRQGDSFGKIIQVYLFAKGLWKSISGNGALIKDRETHAKRRKWNAHTHIQDIYMPFMCLPQKAHSYKGHTSTCRVEKQTHWPDDQN